MNSNHTKISGKRRPARTWLTLSLCAGLAAACGADGGGSPTETDAGTGGTGLGGSGGEGGGGTGGGVTGGDTGGNTGGNTGGTDAGPPPGGAVADMGQPPDVPATPLPDCGTACGALFGCVTEHAPLDAANCQSLCEADPDNGARAFRRCIDRAGADCGAVEACGWPGFLGQPDCLQTCAAASTCPSGVALPEGACEALCAGDQAAAVAGCAEHVYAVTCDRTAFQRCLGEQLPVCESFCNVAPACGFATEERCGADCLAQLLQDDPLAALRQSDILECIGRSGANCGIANQCVTQGMLLDQAGFCAQWQACGFDFQFGPCEQVIPQFLPPGQSFDDYAACLSRAFANGCPARGIEDLFVCLQGQPPAPDCTGACEARAVCGLLPEGQDALACARECFMQIAADPGAASALARGLNCGVFAQSCDELVACQIEQDPATRCATACANAVGCGTEVDAPTCEAACLEEFLNPLWQRWLNCEDAAADCAAAVQCSHEPPAGCEPLCVKRVQCGLEPDADTCRANCALNGLQDPTTNNLRIACTVAAQDCGVPGQDGPIRPDEPPVPVPRGVIDGSDGLTPTVWNCEFDPYTYGLPCAATCLGTTTCVGQDEQAWLDCATDCHAAPVDDAGLARLAAQGCFFEAGRNNGLSCESVAGCALDPADLDCAAYCDRLDGCGLGSADCVATCGELTPGRLRALRSAACVADAAECADVLICVGGETQPVGVSLDVFCPVWDQCDAQWGFGIPCDQIDDFFGGPGGSDAMIQCVWEIIQNGCPPGPDELFERCFRGDRGAVDGQCLAVCAAEQLCAPADDPTRGGCVLTCGNLPFQPPAEAVRASAYYPCAAENTCEGFNACLAASSPEAQCATHCGALSGCGVAEDAAACEAACVASFGSEARRAYRACVVAAGDDCAAVTACPDPSVEYCLQTCTIVAECRVGEPGVLGECMSDCEDDAAVDPFLIGARAECVMTAPSCGGDAREGGVFACWDRGFDITPDACVSYCHGVTTCAETGGFDTCVLDCVNGLDPEDAITLALAGPCLARAGRVCAALTACLDAVADAPPPCEQVCAAVAGCGLAEDADCMTACAEPATAGCVLDATRRPGRCGEASACLGLAFPAPTADCAAYCDKQLVCGAFDDRFLCERGCADDPATMATRAGCAAVTRCADLDACAGLPAAVNAACDAPCDTAVGCGAFADAATCGAYCAGGAASPSAAADYTAATAACLDDLGQACTPADARDCFAPSPFDCASVCDVIAACVPIEDCEGGCRQAQVDDPVGTEHTFDCVYQFLDGLCDLEGFQFCVEGR